MRSALTERSDRLTSWLLASPKLAEKAPERTIFCATRGLAEENLARVDAIEIKIGQSAKPGMGGHLPGVKVTSEIAQVRGRNEGADIISPARFEDIRTREDLKSKVDWLRELSGGKPIGIEVAAGNIEADLECALFSEPDFITLDGRAGATGAAPKVVKDATSIPTIFALCRARKQWQRS